MADRSNPADGIGVSQVAADPAGHGPAVSAKSSLARDISVTRDGLTIDRLFTTPGVHPYDDVEWERRDVLQTNWRTGETVFEQRGVEFPTDWSVNASMIVTTKYFRGAVGTDTRENSLKQLIDRVVLTYTRAGKEHGYFSTPADAEIFEHELTWMLLHQVFSFNSPVWFNVGTNSPQQVSACQPYDALVSTPQGMIPIGKLVEENAIGAKVYDAHGLTSVMAVKSNGVKEVLRIHTKAGHALDVTADHLVWRSTGEGTGKFVPAGELAAGDKLEWHRRDSFGDEEIRASDIAEAALAGWMQSDGFVGQYTGTNKSLTLEAMTVTDAELAWVTAAIDAVFPDVHRHERPVVTIDEALDCRRTRLYGNSLRPFVEAWGLLDRGTAMLVPERLFTAPLPVVAAYLRSVFQAEGFVSARERSTVVEVDMISEQLIRGMQSLLARFGIFARVGFKVDSRENRKGCWTLRIQNEGDRRIFADEIGFIDPVKTEKLNRSFDKPGRDALDVKRLEIAHIETLGEQDVFDIQTESGEYLSSNIRVHNCFILAVDDTMDSILNWYREEGLIFKGGSGAGLNISRIRSSKELLRSSGGTASGPVSFMRGADSSAGTIKSGGATRRAAKMVVLDVDHPDIEEFVETKWREEDKIRALRDAGFDMDLGGKDIHSVQYQNANNSVRVSDEFMRSVEAGDKFDLIARTDGSVIASVDAQGLFDKMCEAAWACADPGIQYDDTINDWHTNPETGRITASNPCFTADTLVATDKGLIAFQELFSRANNGEEFKVWTHDATNPDSPAEVTLLTTPEAFMITGVNPIVRLRFSNGMEVRCTPTHKIFTSNRGYVPAGELTPEDQVRTVDLPTPAVNASWRLPVEPSTMQRGLYESREEIEFPSEWSEELGHYLGWLVGDGSTSAGIVTSIYGSAEDRDEILPKHADLVASLNGGKTPKVSEQSNGTAQLRLTKHIQHRWVSALGVLPVKSPSKRVPSSVLQAPPEVMSSFLQGLFDADGTVISNRDRGAYVGLGSASKNLLQDVQRLLTTFGIFSRIYKIRDASESGIFEYTRRDGSHAEYGNSAGYDLRITGQSADRFAAEIGFSLSRKRALLNELVGGRVRSAYTTSTSVTLVERSDEGQELTYNLKEPRNHSYTANGLVVRNCSEYLSLDNSSCNLASLNLLKFLKDDDTFDAHSFARAVEIVITAMDISICFADFPTEAIGDTTRAYRQLGIGYANLGALLMAVGLAYDSDGGRALAAGITSLMTGTAYKRSAQLAGIVGPYDGYARNATAHARVMRKHAAASDTVRSVTTLDGDVLIAAAKSWQECVEIGTAVGWRNAQASVLAPTGTIGLMMDCDTTGVEPDFSLVKFKKLVGGGSMQIVNQTIPRALRRMGYVDETIEAIIEHIAEHGHVIDAPGLKLEHYSVFDCAMGTRAISPMGHVRMMSAVQPFISGAISKTVNMPETATLDEVKQIYREGWKTGLKALAIYRDNCKVGQPLNDAKAKKADVKETEKTIEYRPVRKRLPKSRAARTVSFSVGGAEGYMTASSYPDGGLGEIFLKMSKQGSTLAGMMDAFSIAISIGLQYGVPLEQYVQKFTNMRFEPAGLTDDPDVRMAQSIMDYIFRRLALDFLPTETREGLGIFTAEERADQVAATYGPQPAQIEALDTVVETLAQTAAIQQQDAPVEQTMRPSSVARPQVHSSTELLEAIQGKAADAPLCFTCGIKMRPAGSCYVCEGCGSTSGCS